MNAFIVLRERIRRFISSYEFWVLKVWNAIIALVGLFSISNSLGYQKSLSSPVPCIILALICAMLPIRGVSFVLIVVTLVNLYSLSADVALVGAGLVLAGYLVCAYFHSRNNYNLVTVPICMHLGTPFVIPMGAGLLRNMNELASVVMGSCTAYYLRLVKINASAILDEASPMSAVSIVKDQMLKSRSFYYFLAGMIAMFLVVYVIRQLDINMAWVVAVVSGTAVEFLIMLVGYLLNGDKSQIGSLVVGNIIVLIVGLIFNYFILDLDYTRTERVQFEDDDYYYYVTAVPKIHVVEEDKEVKKF